MSVFDYQRGYKCSKIRIYYRLKRLKYFGLVGEVLKIRLYLLVVLYKPQRFPYKFGPYEGLNVTAARSFKGEIHQPRTKIRSQMLSGDSLIITKATFIRFHKYNPYNHPLEFKLLSYQEINRYRLKRPKVDASTRR